MPNIDHKDLIIKELSYEDEFYFQWHITDECNLRCRHCYHETYNKNGLAINDLVKIGNHLCDALEKWNRKGSFGITGGEPLLRTKELFQILDVLENRNVDRIDILTNGTLLTDEIIHKLKRYSNFRRIQLSLEGLQETNNRIRGANSYEQTIEAITKLKQNDVTVSVMMTIGKYNKDEVIPLVEELAKHKVDVFVLDRFIPEGQSNTNREWLLSPVEIKEVYEKAYNYFKQSLTPRLLLYRTLFCLLNPDDSHIGAMCSVGNNALTIMPNGDVFPCRRLPVKLGNLLENSIYEIWYTSPFLWEIRNPSNLKGKCLNCQYIPICRGCRAMAYAMDGDYFAQDPQCWKDL
jgi:radical SAM protein with 4Fe4S-binding SPASM domain